jgi:hypothetical protein
MITRSVNILLRWCLALAGMLVVLFEEVLWAWLGGLMGQIGRLPPVAWLENRIRQLPPILALPLFVLPWLIMLPVKLAALWLIAIGKVANGIMLFVGGEAFGVAFLARLYELCRPALHTWPWFVIVERVLLRWSRWAHGILADLPLVRSNRARCEQWWREIKRQLVALRQRATPPKL